MGTTAQLIGPLPAQGKGALDGTTSATGTHIPAWICETPATLMDGGTMRGLVVVSLLCIRRQLRLGIMV